MKPISWYKSLSESAYRREAGCFLVEGARGVDQLLTFRREHVVELLIVDGCDIVQSADDNHADIPTRVISSANMKSIATSRTPQGVAAVVRIPDGVYTSNIPQKLSGNILLLDDVQDPGNVGTLIRTAAAFGYGGIIMSNKCADPFSPKVVQSTAGSLLSLWIRRNDGYQDMAEELKAQGYKLIAADLSGEDITVNSQTFTNPHVLILGNEGSGISSSLLDKCDKRIRIPIATSGAESLNVAISGGILMFLDRNGFDVI